jgi:hypothetical protein
VDVGLNLAHVIGQKGRTIHSLQARSGCQMRADNATKVVSVRAATRAQAEQGAEMIMDLIESTSVDYPRAKGKGNSYGPGDDGGEREGDEGDAGGGWGGDGGGGGGGGGRDGGKGGRGGRQGGRGRGHKGGRGANR